MNERAGKPKINNDTRPSTKREVETQAFQERIVIPSYESSLDIWRDLYNNKKPGICWKFKMLKI